MFDKSIFLSQRIANKNSDIMNLYFKLNKKLDNFVDYIGVSLNMNNMSTALHQKYAHLAPVIADDFSDYNSLYSYRSVYGTIAGETTEYTDFISGIEDILDLLNDIDINLSDAKMLGVDEGNDDYIKFIDNEELNLRKFKKQFILIYDKASFALENGNTVQDIDHYYEDYIIE